MSKDMEKVENQVTEEPKVNFITAILEASKQQFLAVNAGMDLDYVRMGEWVKINKKGNFVLRADEDTSFGDSLDVVIAMGEQRYMLWGKDNTPEKNTLIVAEKTMDDAVEMLQEFLAARPEAGERYAPSDIQLRYLAYVVPVQYLNGEDMPEVYLVSFAPGDTFGFGSYAKDVFRGMKDKGIPKSAGVNTVVTRLTTEERKVQNSTDTYLGLKFEAVGPFIPADYGIKQD